MTWIAYHGWLKGGKLEPFWFRFAFFSVICLADFLLFPPRLARSNPILGQKWVKNFLQKCYKMLTLSVCSQKTLITDHLSF